MVRFENVGMRYGLGPEVLKDVSFTLAAGSFHFVTGPSGAGKSSLLKLLSLAHRPSRGLITMFDHEVITAPRPILAQLRRKIGIVFQDFRLLDHLSARDNVALPLRITGHEPAEIKRRVSVLLDWVNLGARMEAYPPTLSGGEKQRLAIARAVIRRPSLLIADEPTGNVDPSMSLRLLRFFEELNREGTTIVLATHDQWLMSHFDHPCLRLDHGTLSLQPGPGALAR